MTYERSKVVKPQPKSSQEPVQEQEPVTMPVPSSTIAPELQGYVDQIRSELFEEKSTPAVESEFTDDTHNWGDTEESEEYWHFVGRYE